MKDVYFCDKCDENVKGNLRFSAVICSKCSMIIEDRYPWVKIPVVEVKENGTE